MATIYKVDCPNRKPLFEGVQGENEARSIQFDITAWVEELGAGAVTATAKRPTDAQPYPVTIEQGDGNIVTWKPTSTDTAFEGVGSFQLEYTVDDVLAKTCIWSTQIAPSLDPAGDPPDPYDNWLASMREVAAAAQQSANDSAASAQQAAGEVTNAQTEVKNAEAWAVGTKGGVDVPSTDEAYHNNAKYWAEKSNENQYGAYITKSASGSIASFADGGDDIPMKSLKVAIVPKQAGSGDPSTSNVRPITGTSTANVTVTGKNLFDSARFLEATGWTENNGVYRGADYYIATNHASGSPYLFRFPEPQSRQVCVSFDAKGEDTERNGYMRFEYSDGTQVAIAEVKGTSWTHYTMISNPSKQVVNVNFIYSNAKIMEIKNFQIEYASTPTEFEQFGHTTPVPLGQTVYGGELNPISGELKITHAYKTFGQLEWVLTSAETTGDLFYAPILDAVDINTKGHLGWCDKYACYIHATAGWWYRSMGNLEFIYSVSDISGQKRIYVRDNSYSDVNSFVSANANTQLVYELATPITVQLTPAEVRTLLGDNNVWSDAGSVEVEYRADPTLAYAELQALILENN